MLVIETNLINAVYFKINTEAHEHANKLSEYLINSNKTVREYKNILMQLIGVFYWNQIKDIDTLDNIDPILNMREHFINKIENTNSLDVLDEILHEIIDYYTSNQDSLIKKCENPLIKTILNYIYTNSDKKITLEILSKQFHISRSYLSTLICQNTGSSLPNILNQFRIEKSCLLLTHTNESISDIAQKVGFQSDSYFCQQFKNSKKVTPKKFRAITKN